MTLRPTARFAADYDALPQQLRQRVDEALGLLFENPRHPSLHYRFIFAIDGDTYVLLRVGTHDLLKFRA